MSADSGAVGDERVDGTQRPLRRPLRVLAVCSVGGAGHLRPMLPLLLAARDRGDKVTLVAPESVRPIAMEAGLDMTPLGLPTDEVMAPILARLPKASREEERQLGQVELFGRLATQAALPAVEAAVDAARPDLILRDPCEYASVLVATREHRHLATIAISQSVATWEMYDLVTDALEAQLVGATATMRRSPYITAFPAGLDPSPFPMTLRLRAEEPPAQPLPDWWPGDTRPLVYLTMGTVLGMMDIATTVLRAVVEGVAPLPVRVLLTTGRDVDPASLGPLPPNVHAEQWVTQADALAAASLVVCHGGSGTTFAALAAGVPLVVIPVFADQFINGRLVASTGAGRCVESPPGTSGAHPPPGPHLVPSITAAVEALLDDAGVRSAAARVAAEMAAGAGSPGEVLAQLDRSRSAKSGAIIGERGPE